MKLVMTLGLLLSSSITGAAPTIPGHCIPLQVKDAGITIEAKEPTLIYINNLTRNTLWLTHPISNPSASAGWTSQLQGGNWSALSVNKGPFALTCMQLKPGREQKIPCEGAIAVCQWQSVKMPQTATSTFWVAENLPLGSLTTTVVTRGFVLPKGS